jgi:chitodextrinase
MPDTQAPTAPGNLVATAASGTQINLTWTAATDNIGVTGYQVERCQGVGCTTFTQVGTPTGLTFSDIGRTPATSYSYRVRATDAANNASPYVGPASAVTLDTVAPTAPGSPSATATSTSAITVTWTAATDNVGVTGYQVERCQGAGCTTFAPVAVPTGLTFNDTGLAASTSYSYRVRATDAASNLGPYSVTASATTQSIPDEQAPTAPTNLVATAVSGTQINLTWTAATDNVGVTAYQVERCQGAGCTTFVPVGTPTGTSFNDTGLTVGTTYSYRVRATDAATNAGPYSTTASVTTQTTVPGLVAAYGFNEGAGTTAGDGSGNGRTGTLVNATWTATGKNGRGSMWRTPRRCG